MNPKKSKTDFFSKLVVLKLSVKIPFWQLNPSRWAWLSQVRRAGIYPEICKSCRKISISEKKKKKPGSKRPEILISTLLITFNMT